jgi:hypothetical protein
MVAFGAAAAVVRRMRSEIERGQIGPNGWVDALEEIETILDFALLTSYERSVVRGAMISLINKQRVLLNKPRLRADKVDPVGSQGDE